MTSTVGEQLLHDMKALDDLLGAQQKVASKSSFETMLTNQFQFMMGKLDHLAGQVSLAEAAAISNALATSLWTVPQREALVEKVSSCTTLGSNKKARRPLQTLTAFSCYLTASDKTLLASDAHSIVKLEGVVARCMALGLHLPSEPTVAGIVATMIECGIKAESDSAKWELLKAFKSIIKAKVKHAPQCIQHIVKYPASPGDLPACIYKTCYGEEGPDANASPSLGMSSSDIPKRKSNIKVRTTVPGVASAQNEMLMQMFHCMMERMGGSSSGSGFDVQNLQIFANKKRQKALGDVPETQPSSRAATASTTTLALENKPEAVQPVKPQEPAVETESQQTEGSTEVPKDVKNEDLFDLDSLNPKPNNTRAEETAKLVEGAFANRESQKKQPQRDDNGSPQNPKAVGKGKAKAKAKAKGKASPKAVCTPKKTSGIIKTSPKTITPPKPGAGTFHYKNGKIHRNDRSSCWRVFVNKTDRCDKKILFKGDEVSSFRKALAMIEAGK